MDAGNESLTDEELAAYARYGTLPSRMLSPVPEPTPIPPMAEQCATCPFQEDVGPFREYLKGFAAKLPPAVRKMYVIQDEVDAALMVLTGLSLRGFICHYGLASSMMDGSIETAVRERGDPLTPVHRLCAGAHPEPMDGPAVRRARELIAATSGPLRREYRNRIMRLVNMVVFENVLIAVNGAKDNATLDAFPSQVRVAIKLWEDAV